MSTVSALTLALAAILLGIRLPSFLDRQGVKKADKIKIIVFMYAVLIGAAFFVSNPFGLLFN